MKTIYFKKGDSQTDELSVFIQYLPNNNYYMACIKTQSRIFLTLRGAINWMARKGFILNVN